MCGFLKWEGRSFGGNERKDVYDGGSCVLRRICFTFQRIFINWRKESEIKISGF